MAEALLVVWRNRTCAMTWVKIDDQFADHPKLAEMEHLAPLAGWMYVCGLCYCARYLTDGFIPRGQLSRLASFDGIGDLGSKHPERGVLWEDLEDQLVRAGLWEDAPKGIWVHDYLDYNPSREQVLAEKAAKVEAGRRGGQASAQARAQAGAVAGGQADAQAKSKQGLKQNPTPSPSPFPKEENPPIPPLAQLAVDEIPTTESTPEDYQRTIERHAPRLRDQTIKQTIYELAAWEPKTPRKKLHLTLNTWLAKKPDDREVEEEKEPGYQLFTAADIPDYWPQT